MTSLSSVSFAIQLKARDGKIVNNWQLKQASAVRSIESHRFKRIKHKCGTRDNINFVTQWAQHLLDQAAFQKARVLYIQRLCMNNMLMYVA